jgi:hypothetical protein
VVVLALLLVGCRDNLLTNPPAPRPGHIASDDGAPALAVAPVLVGNSAIPVPDPWGDVDWTSMVAPIPPASWVRVHVEGTIHLDGNPAYEATVCAPDAVVTCHPASPLNGKDIGPLGVADPALGNPDYAVLVVSAMMDTPLANLMWPLDRRGDGQSWDAIEWVPRGAPGVQIYRLGNHRSFFGTPAYLMSGNQTVTVEVVPPPARIVASAGPGAATHFTFAPAQPYSAYGMEWYFVGQDTTAMPNWNFGGFLGDFALQPIHIPGCDGASMCDYAPPKGGRVYVRAGLMLGADLVALPSYFAGEVTGGGLPTTVVLGCVGDLGSGRVTRASTVRCEVRKQPSSAPDSLQVLSWVFENRARTDGDVHATEWEGEIVREGTVTLRAQLGSQAVTKTARINVEPRANWPDLRITRVQHNITVDPVSMAPYPPNGATFGRHQLGGLDLDSLKVDSVLHGPNTGYFYVKDAVRMLPSKIFVHPALYAGGLLPNTMGPLTPGYSDWLAWYSDQNGHGSGSCQAAGVDLFRQNVERHEGLTLAANSHVGVSNQYFLDDHTQRRLEKVVSDANVEDLKYRLAVLFDRLTDSKSTYAAKQATFDTNDTPNVYHIGCTLDNNRSDP